MPATTKTQYEADITIKGVQDSSVARVLGLTVAELKKFQRSVNDISAIQNKMTASKNGLLPTPQAFKDATRQAEGFRGVMGKISTIAGGVAVGELLARGFGFAISQAEMFTGKIGEAVNKAAEFKTMKLQLQIETGDTPQQLTELLDQLQWTANKSPFKLPALSEGLRKLMSMGFNDQKQALQFEHAEMNLAAATKSPSQSYDEHFKEINEAFSKAIAQGHIMERNLYMLENAGIKIRPWLEQKIGLPIGTMGDLESDESLNAIRKAVKKGQLNSSMLLGFATEQTAPGAKYSDTAVAPLIRNYAGATSTFGDTWDQFMRGFGSAIETPFTNLVNHINDAFTWDKFKGVQSFFEKMSEASAKFFDPIIEKLFKGDWGKTGKDLTTLIDRMGRDFGKLQEPLLVLADRMPQIIDFMIQFAKAIERILAAFGNAAGWINKWGDRGEKFFSNVENAINPSGANQVVQSASVLAAQQKLNDLVSFAASDEQIEKAKSDLLAAEKAQKTQTDDVNSSLKNMQSILDSVNLSLLKVSGGMSPTGYVGGGLSDDPGCVYYEHPDTEGHSSQYGPEGNALGYGYGIGVGKDLQAETGARYGKWVKVRLPNGETVIRQVNETSARNHGIEFVTPSGDERSYGNGKARIEGVYDTKPSASNTTVNFNITAIDSGDVHRFLIEHGNRIADHLHRITREQASFQAVV